MRTGEPVGHFAIDRRHGFEGEFANIDPRVVELGLVKIAAIFKDKAPWLMWRWLFYVEFKAQRGSRRHTADANVDEMIASWQRNSQKHVRSRWRKIAWALVAHPCADRLRIEAELLQHAQHQRVLLETVAASPARDQLIVDSVGFK